MAKLTFDSSSVPPATERTPIPAGEYIAMITATDVLPTKADPANKYLKLTVEIVDGAMKGRKVFANLNIVNTNTQAQDIAQRELSAVCHAIGRPRIEASEELHDTPLRVKITIDKDGYNKVAAWSAYAPANQAKTNAVVLEAGKRPPWGK